MSPVKRGSILDKTVLINRMVPMMMRAFSLSRPEAQEALAYLNPEERMFLYTLKGKAQFVKTRKKASLK